MRILLLMPGSERMRLGEPGVTRAWSLTFKHVLPIAQAGVEGEGVGVLVGLDVALIIGVIVVVGVSVGVNVVVGFTVAVGVAAGPHASRIHASVRTPSFLLS